jgi:hypothetical protein
MKPICWEQNQFSYAKKEVDKWNGLPDVLKVTKGQYGHRLKIEKAHHDLYHHQYTCYKPTGRSTTLLSNNNIICYVDCQL